MVTIFGKDRPRRTKGDRTVSYTQFSIYKKCPKHWELLYSRRLGKREPNINLLFGTAMHETIQAWVDSIFNGDGSYDYVKGLNKNMLGEFHKMVTKYGEPFSDMETIMEYYDDGIQILNYMSDKLRGYFNPRKYKFIGIEVPIVYVPNLDKPNLKLFAHLDLVFEEIYTGNIEVVDIKTSKTGWGYYQKGDMTKQAQLLLYKYYLAKMYDLDINKINTRYFIVKRKSDDTMWGKERVQEFAPIQSTKMCNEVAAEFEEFISDSFDDDGVPIGGKNYPAIEGENKYNCKFCEFAERDDLCPKKFRK